MLSCFPSFFHSKLHCVKTKGHFPVTNEIWLVVWRKNQHCICRQLELELNYYRNIHSLLFASEVLPWAQPSALLHYYLPCCTDRATYPQSPSPVSQAQTNSILVLQFIVSHTTVYFSSGQMSSLYFQWPTNPIKCFCQQLLCSISVWHSSTNCMKLGLQPLLHPISGGHEGSSWL